MAVCSPEDKDMHYPGISLEKALEQLINKLNSWFTLAVKMLPNLIVAIMVVVIVIKLSNPLATLVGRAIVRITRQRHIARLFATMTRLIAITLGIILALNVMNLDRAVASLLAGVGILGIAFGFASQDIAANFMSGILLHFVHPFRLDDFILSGEFLGYVETIDMRSTKIRNQQGQRITIPNKTILGNPLTNYTISGVRRVDIPWSLTQVEDLQKAEELAVKAVESLQWRIPDRPVELFYEKVGDYSIDFEIRFWTDPDQKVYLTARSEAIKAIKRTFEEHGIPMPSPVRVLDFGIVGGKDLRGQLEGVKLSLLAAQEERTGKGKGKDKISPIP
ncbi:MAG: mechanosensitive ion channel family protein [Desulfobaccales bacterium]